jgi:hypothetical protein
MRSAFIAGAAGAAAFVAGLMFDAGVVSAHSPSYSLSCEGATITGQAYDAVDTNTATIYIDGTEVFGQTFATSVDGSVDVPQDGAVHSVRFVIDVELAAGGEVPAGWELDVTDDHDDDHHHHHHHHDHHAVADDHRAAAVVELVAAELVHAADDRAR